MQTLFNRVFFCLLMPLLCSFGASQVEGYTGIVFDFNGVILWDTHVHEEAWMECSLEWRGTCLTQEEMDAHMHGRPNRYVIEYLLGRSISEQELVEYTQKKELVYQRLCLEHPEEYGLSPGAEKLFTYLQKKGIPFTIATASPEINIPFYWKHLKLGTWFDFKKIVYDDGTYHNKKQIFIQAAKNLGLTPQDCLVIEDSHSGIAAAKEAKMGKIIALGPKSKHGDLRNLDGVAHVITTLGELLTPEENACPWYLF